MRLAITVITGVVLATAGSGVHAQTTPTAAPSHAGGRPRQGLAPNGGAARACCSQACREARREIQKQGEVRRSEERYGREVRRPRTGRIGNQGFSPRSF